MAQYQVKNPDRLIELNAQINSLFKKESFSLVRIGNTEGYFLECFLRGVPPAKEFYEWITTTAGVFPNTDDYLKNIWAPINEEAMKNSDMLGFVDISKQLKNNKEFNLKYCEGKNTFFGEDEILVMDPGYLSDIDIVNVPCPDPWTRNLKGKKVLVVSAFEHSIKHQWENIEKIWEDRTEDIAGFDLVGVIRSPFNPSVDSRQFPNCDTWDLVAEELKRQIDTYKYDVLLVSAGAWAPTLADHAKKRGKIGITLCGSLQLFFGIVGTRWAGPNKSYADWYKMFNEHWRWPSEDDLPTNKQRFDRFEKAYWQ